MDAVKTVDTIIPNSVEGVTAFAAKHGIKFGFGTTPEMAAATSSFGEFDFLERVDLLKFAVSHYPTRSAGLSSRDRGDLSVTVYGMDGWTPSTYASALHEFGHVYAVQFPVDSVDKDVINAEEAFAWRWAESHADHWSADMEEHRRMSLASYGINIRGEKL